MDMGTGVICTDGFNNDAANVACRQLGCIQHSDDYCFNSRCALIVNTTIYGNTTTYMDMI